jgi:hypothetical protein
MNIIETILKAQGGGVVRELGDQLGLSEGQTQSALGALLPVLAGAMSRNVQSEGGLESLLGALGGGSHDRYLEDPSLLHQQSTVEDGNGILGHLLGSKEVSRQVASRASAQTGIGVDILKQMLPLAASLLMGSMSRGAGSQSLDQARAPQQEGILGMLTPLLDQDRDGSALDDILGMASRFLSR